MVIHAGHWVSALSVASVAHVAALIWLSQPTARVDPPKVTTGIVIALEDSQSLSRDTPSPLHPPSDSAHDLEAPTLISERGPTPVMQQPAPTNTDEPALTQPETTPPEPSMRLSPDSADEPAVEATPAIATPSWAHEIATVSPSEIPQPSIVATEFRPETISGQTPVIRGDRIKQPVSGLAIPPTAAGEPQIRSLTGAETPYYESPVGTETHETVKEPPRTVYEHAQTGEVVATIDEPKHTVATMQLEPVHAGDTVDRDLLPIEAMSPPQQPVEKDIDAIENSAAEGLETSRSRTPAQAVSLAPSEGVVAHAAPATVVSEPQRPVLGVTARYAGLLKGWLQRHMRYPREAWLAGVQGTTVLRFSIDRDGKVMASSLERSSGHKLLDREAIQMVRRADPFPAIPYEIAGHELELRVPIVFFIRDFERQREMPPIYLD